MKSGETAEAAQNVLAVWVLCLYFAPDRMGNVLPFSLLNRRLARRLCRYSWLLSPGLLAVQMKCIAPSTVSGVVIQFPKQEISPAEVAPFSFGRSACGKKKQEA